MGVDALLPSLVALVSGTTIGFILGLIPGIGGRTGIIVFLPAATLFDPYPAAIFLFALQSVLNTSSSIPNIALGVPTSAADAATILDGYPLTKQGRGGEALGASLSASAIGGVLGALAFAAAIPVAYAVLRNFGPPETLLLAIIGITMVSSLSPEGIARGFIIAAFGLLCGMVGHDTRTGEVRFTFGLLDLWDGISLPAMITGFFVVPDMLAERKHADTAAKARAVGTRLRDVWFGMFITLRHMAVVLRSTLYGILVGAAPAVGSSVAVWMSYAYAARTTKSDVPFGQGAIAGVIAPEAANNSKEGGAMIPTLFFGIPGSSGMAVMMAALTVVGVAVGPNMLDRDLPLSYALTATVILSNLLAIPLFFLVVPFIVRLGALNREAIAPFAIVVSVTAALITLPAVGTLVQVLAGAVVGIALKMARWPRAPFILGFVLADMFERSYFLTVRIYGLAALGRPVVLVLAAALLAWLWYSTRLRSAEPVSGPATLNLPLAGTFLAAFALAGAMSVSLPFSSAVGPVTVALAGAALCLWVAGRTLIAGQAGSAVHVLPNVAVTGFFLAAAPILGIVGAGFVYIVTVLRRLGYGPGRAGSYAAIASIVQLALLGLIFDVRIEKAIMGMMLWSLAGF